MKNAISQLRKQHKITQEELANEVGVTRQTITSIETEKYIASLPLAFKIAKFFDMSIEEIFSIEEDD
ncbi:helix-turn-helix transcriptional regulator [Gardnerella pickettii]|uniref:helix-turn-helix transcriptional regulator n=1 Tax=Gardnerella TaxID=2701 RepID=UPI002A2A657A|nr:helix-turn-helix transcriptional regulator [Gardnerella swidsinskii]MDK7093792.1 helix-turn-helix transcriptional regulator [Gardnerella swidsinskii]